MTELASAGGPWGTRLCTWAIYLAAIGLLLVLIAGPGYRSGMLPMLAGMLGYPIASLALLLATIFAVVGLIMTSGSAGNASQGLTITALIIGVVITTNNLVWLNRTIGAPGIHDITTDLESPPEFVAVIPLRADSPNPPEYSGPETAEQQRAAYPDIETIVLLDSPGFAFDSALATAKDMGWEIVDSNPGEGRIEATATTSYFGFKDDIVIRITSEGPEAHVDVRSKSRMGRGDMATNANRIREFRQRLIKQAEP